MNPILIVSFDTWALAPAAQATISIGDKRCSRNVNGYFKIAS